MATSQILVGTRVRHMDGYCGTVRYAGPLLHQPPSLQSGQDALWYGVEWDEDGHGKNNGTVQNVPYFACPAGRGSLLKPDRVQPAVSLLEALTLRYTEDYSPEEIAARGRRCSTHGADPFVRESLTGAFLNVKQTDCQANFDLSCVGFGNNELCATPSTEEPRTTRPWQLWDPRRNAAQFRSASTGSADALGSTPPGATPSGPLAGNSPHKLRRVADVCDDADDEGKVQHLKESLLPAQPVIGDLALWFPNLSVLVLKGTLVSTWKTVEYVARNLPRLHSLNVSDTHLGPLSLSDADLFSTPWSATLTTLSANHVGGNLMTLTLLLGAFDSLSEINFGRNALGGADLDEFSALWQSTNTLPVKQRVARVGWTVLERLHLEKSGITDVSFLQSWFEIIRDEGNTAVSTSLRHLNLNENKVRSVETRPSTSVFGNTTSLWMRGANFTSWDACALKLLNTFPSLAELIFSDDDLAESSLPQDPSPASRSHRPSFSDGMPSYGTHFDQTTLERFRFMVAVFPNQIQRLNNSTLTSQEWAAAERMALHLYLKPYMEFLDNTESNPGRAHPTPSQLGANVPTLMLAMVAKHVSEQEKLGGVKLFVPKPRFKRDEYGLHVVFTTISFEEMCNVRQSTGFEGVVREHMDAMGVGHKKSASSMQLDVEALNAVGAAKDPRKTVVDVRWNVQRLRQHLVEHLDLEDRVVDPLMNFAHEEDHWTAAEYALIALSLPILTPEAANRRAKLLANLPVPLKRIFPSGSVVMFHFDMELAANEGATEKGLHCKHLVRPSDKLYEHRISDGDAIVVVMFA